MIMHMSGLLAEFTCWF